MQFQFLNKINRTNLSVQMAPRAVNWVEMPLQQYFIVFWGAPDALMNQASHWASQQVSDKITLKRLPVNPWPQKPCISWIQEKWMALTMESNPFWRIILNLEQLFFKRYLSKAMEKINNNWIDAKYSQMALRSARWHCSWAFIFGTPGQTNVMQM